MRYYSNFRGEKVLNAEKYGAIGAIIYTDPAEYASDGIEPGFIFKKIL